MLGLAAIEAAGDHTLDSADDEDGGPRDAHLGRGVLAVLPHRPRQAVEDFLVLDEGRAAGDVYLADQRSRDQRPIRGELEHGVQTGLCARPPILFPLGRHQHGDAEILGLRLVGRGEAGWEAGEVRGELLGRRLAAGKQRLQGDGAVADFPAQLQHRRLDAATRGVVAGSFAVPRRLFSHIGGPPPLGDFVPAPERASREENYIPLKENVAPTQQAGYLAPMERPPEEAPVVPLGRHGLAPDVVAAHQRQRLFEATVDLVAKRGYRDTSIDQIVKAARVGYVAFYDLFDGKEACFLACFDRIVEEATAAVAEAVADEQEWPRQVATALGCLIDLAVADPKRARVALVEVQAASPAAYARYEAAIDRAAPKLREGRELSPEAGRFSATLEEATLGGVTWVVRQRLVKGELKQAESLLEETIQIALSPYVGDAEARAVAAGILRERSQRR